VPAIFDSYIYKAVWVPEMTKPQKGGKSNPNRKTGAEAKEITNDKMKNARKAKQKKKEEKEKNERKKTEEPESASTVVDSSPEVSKDDQPTETVESGGTSETVGAAKASHKTEHRRRYWNPTTFTRKDLNTRMHAFSKNKKKKPKDNIACAYFRGKCGLSSSGRMNQVDKALCYSEMPERYLEEGKDTTEYITKRVCQKHYGTRREVFQGLAHQTVSGLVREKLDAKDVTHNGKLKKRFVSKVPREPTRSLGWFHRLTKEERNRYKEIPKRVREVHIWGNVNRHMAGFKKVPHEKYVQEETEAAVSTIRAYLNPGKTQGVRASRSRQP
jgi:hypothetical protein